MVEEGRLKFWLSKYDNPDVVLRDVQTVKNHYAGLVPGQEVYTFNHGMRRELVNLNGTIPVRYKGATYNIPICIWLIDTHPNHAPICYVKPTPDMSIKVSRYVDHSGKIYLPYLSDWQIGASDLIGLIQVMIVTFGEEPPVFAKPKDTVSNPPYPMGGMNYPPYPPSSTSSGYNAGGYPPYPPATSSSGYPPYPPTNFTPYPMQPQPNPPPVMPTTGTIKDEHIRESLLTAIEEKLLRRMKEQFQQNQAELETLKRTQEELRQGKVRLEGILGKMEKDQNDLDRNIAVLKDKEQELEKAIEKLSTQESIDVDDAVTTTAPLYKQLLNAFAEEAALEDTIYYMGEALRCGVIDLDIFLKQVRTLSRKQFTLRATMQKCRQKAGLSC